MSTTNRNNDISMVHGAAHRGQSTPHFLSNRISELNRTASVALACRPLIGVGKDGSATGEVAFISSRVLESGSGAPAVQRRRMKRETRQDPVMIS